MLKVKNKDDLFFKEDGIIPRGTVLNVTTEENSPFYRIVDGPYKGGEYWIHHFEKIDKIHSEKELKDMENYYMSLLDKERAAKNRAIELAANISKQIVDKNKEIEKLNFYISALTIGLSASSEAIQILKEKA